MLLQTAEATKNPRPTFCEATDRQGVHDGDFGKMIRN